MATPPASDVQNVRPLPGDEVQHDGAAARARVGGSDGERAKQVKLTAPSADFRATAARPSLGSTA